MIARFKRPFRSALLIANFLTFFTGKLFATELALVSEQSALRYTALKYGTMQVDGVLSESGKTGLSGNVLLEKAGTDYQVSGEINLEYVAFDSGHARRDDAVAGLFKTPVNLSLRAAQPCVPELGSCPFNITLALNGHTEEFAQDIVFYRESAQVKAEGTFGIVRQSFDLVFKDGFASTLDIAVSSEIDIGFTLAFEGIEFKDLERLPVQRMRQNGDDVEALDLGQGSETGLLEKVRAWLESF